MVANANVKGKNVIFNEKRNQWEQEKLVCFLDGNALCITRDDFEDLQASPAMFLDLTEKQIDSFNELRKEKEDEKPKVCNSCNQKDIGQTGEYPCEVCGLPTVWDESFTKSIKQMMGEK